MKISKGPKVFIEQTTNFRSITTWVNSHHLCSEILAELEGLRSKVKKDKNKRKEEAKGRITSDMEDRKKLYTTLQNCTCSLEVEQHITTKLVNIYSGKEASENVNVTKPVNIGVQQIIEFQQNLSEWFHERLPSYVITLSERKQKILKL